MKNILKLIIIVLVVIAVLLFIGLKIYQKYYYPYSGNALPITEEDLKRGSYWGFENQKKPGTPDDWVWVDAGISSNWRSPNFTLPK